MADYVRELPRLEAAQTTRVIDALLFTAQRGMRDDQRRKYARELDQALHGGTPRRAPKVTRGFLERINRATRSDRKKKGGEKTK